MTTLHKVETATEKKAMLLTKHNFQHIFFLWIFLMKCIICSTRISPLKYFTYIFLVMMKVNLVIVPEFYFSMFLIFDWIRIRSPLQWQKRHDQTTNQIGRGSWLAQHTPKCFDKMAANYFKTINYKWNLRCTRKWGQSQNRFFFACSKFQVLKSVFVIAG